MILEISEARLTDRIVVRQKRQPRSRSLISVSFILSGLGSGFGQWLWTVSIDLNTHFRTGIHKDDHHIYLAYCNPPLQFVRSGILRQGWDPVRLAKNNCVYFRRWLIFGAA
jgi:hypothetical protein